MSWEEVMAENQLGWGIVEQGWRKGPWTSEEDRLLIEYVKLHGEGRWNSVSRLAGLKRNGKSCRLRWVNYLRPDLKRGQITPHEEKIILELHARWGNRWSTIARSLPGRTDNEIKNYWRTHFKKKATRGSSSSSTSISDADNYKNSEKSRARLLRRQQFHHQQRQQQLQQQQQQQQQNYDDHHHIQAEMFDDMKKLMSLFDETDGNNHQLMIKKDVNHGAVVPLQTTAIVPSHYSTSADHHDHQVFLCSMFNSYAMPGETNDQDFIWNGLWNMDDLNGSINYSRNAHFHHTSATTAAAAATPFY